MPKEKIKSPKIKDERGFHNLALILMTGAFSVRAEETL